MPRVTQELPATDYSVDMLLTRLKPRQLLKLIAVLLLEWPVGECYI